MEIWLPVKPYGVNQLFGGNPDYYKKFLDRFGHPQKGHPGMDLKAAHATALYAPVEGQAYYLEDDHGGDGIYIRTPLIDGKYYTVILWHLCGKNDRNFHPLIPTDGSLHPVEVGQLIGYTDNSGAPYESSGDHLHIGLFECDVNGNALYPANGYGGCIDPLPFFNMKFAEDYMIAEKALEAASKIVMEPSLTPQMQTDLFPTLTKFLNFLKLFFQRSNTP